MLEPERRKKSNLPLLVLFSLFPATIFFGLNQQTFSSLNELYFKSNCMKSQEQITGIPAAAVSFRFQLQRRICLQIRVNEY
jgi:hypothetical protein